MELLGPGDGEDVLAKGLVRRCPEFDDILLYFGGGWLVKSDLVMGTEQHQAKQHGVVAEAGRKCAEEGKEIVSCVKDVSSRLCREFYDQKKREVARCVDRSVLNFLMLFEMKRD